ncbi:Vitamin B12 dependent methionine synthase, activation domain [Ruminococcus sp. YE71]|uniref:vitamin B12 dependent-methionine synthase activation domain-containing protein n=1 Tax=unclassified Ruminococcus TaxID=2608920 RepID=UPI0008864EB0|nr:MULTISPECIES: vitamin B12 dependent-methionine synthase activation domain-containing protein [unclassified Ruminococcus]SDA24247.1 Vitamin B12 dependent methionine synthase, activation domain [Ruminococcus sp. YE78]SFW41692.1 Vitamin B12 dependent methionine synthase, activation domain [Ruminococcus sp. YE71]
MPDSIRLKIDIDEAIRYMGYREAPNKQQLETIRGLAELIEKDTKPAWVYRVFPIIETEDGIELKGTKLVLTGSSVRKHLKGCDSAVLLCATISAKADEIIRQKEREDIALGFMTDCLASAAVESICNEIERMLAEKFSTKFFTWRFSPGYGDLPLDVQPYIIEVLGAGKRAGVTCTPSLMMIPSKSVTAVIGLSDVPIDRGRRGCAVCNLSGTCEFRKRGVRCGT